MRPPSVVRSQVAVQSNHHAYKPDLREDFHFACAYCSLSESEARGIAFEIEHYIPVTHPEGKSHAATYENLMWSCAQCNGAKSNDFPSAGLLDKCLRYYRADWEAFADTFELDGDELKGRSPVGDFSINALCLNASSQQRLRQLRRQILDDEDHIAEGLSFLFGVSLDTINRDARFRYKGILKKLEEQATLQQSDVRRLIHEANQSPLLGHTRTEALAARRDYFQQIGLLRGQKQPKK